MTLSRWTKQTHVTNVGGRWCTKKYLEEVCHYSKSMIDASFAHARSMGLVRTNNVHKEEEARLVLDDTFNNRDETGSSQQLSSSAAIED